MKEQKTKTVLVTGSSGLIGSESVKFFIKKGFNVVGIDNNMREYFFGPEASTEWQTKEMVDKYADKFTFFSIDIRDNEKIAKLFQTYLFSAVIHTAAQPSHD